MLLDLSAGVDEELSKVVLTALGQPLALTSMGWRA
jgi:hypothetical protein